MRFVGRLLLLIVCAAVSACSSVRDDKGQDPLKNTRKFFTETPVAIYKEGQLQVPMTTIHLIPPGPSALELAGEMVGVYAVQSAQESLTHARESLHLAQAGVARSVDIARAVNQGTNTAAAAPHAAIAMGGTVVSAAPGVRGRAVDTASAFAERTEGALQGAGKDMADAAPRAGERIVTASENAGDRARANIGEAGKSLADGALETGERIVSASENTGDRARTNIGEAGKSLAEGALEKGGEIGRSAERTSGAMWEGSKVGASRVSGASEDAAARHLSYAWERFSQGNAALPDKTREHVAAAAQSFSLDHFLEAARNANRRRNSQSATLISTMHETAANYGDDVSKAFDAASQEVSPEAKQKSGPVLAALNSLGWKAKGILWDATTKPAGKMVGAGVGWVVVNGVIFPVMVTGDGAVSVANVAVQVTWNVAAEAYDLTAPTTTAAVAGLFGLVEAAGGKAIALGELAGGGAAAASTYGAGKTAAGLTAASGWTAGKAVEAGAPVASVGMRAGGSVLGGATAGVGWVAGKAVEASAPAASVAIRAGGNVLGGATTAGGWIVGNTLYIAAPVASLGIKGGGQLVGATAGVATATAGVGMAAAGGAGELATQAVGKTTAGAIGAGGSVVSVVGGGALGAYELAKMYVVPTAHVMGSGLVLGYGALSQLGAQAVNAAGGAAYMVASREGQHWVLYAVKGDVDKGDHLPPGTMLDLNAMQKAGETFYVMPVSDEEMQRVLEAVPSDLPVKAAPADTPGR